MATSKDQVESDQLIVDDQKETTGSQDAGSVSTDSYQKSDGESEADAFRPTLSLDNKTQNSEASTDSKLSDLNSLQEQSLSDINSPQDQSLSNISSPLDQNSSDLNAPQDQQLSEPSSSDIQKSDVSISSEKSNELVSQSDVNERNVLKVGLPPLVTDTKDELPPLDSNVANVTDGLENSQKNGAKSTDPSESVYHIKWVEFRKKKVPIITQNENGPCPLLAIVNVLLLQNRVKLAQSAEYITGSQLMAHVGECVLENVPNDDGVTPTARLNFEQNMHDAMAVMPRLQTGLDVNVRFTGVRDFEYTTECIIFDLLQISLYHGWLVDPQNGEEVEAMSGCSYNQLVEKIILQKSSDNPDHVSQALIAEQFLESSAAQLTYHGLCELCSTVKDDELAVFFRNNHFTTLYRHKDELFQLVTDQGFLRESNVVWETLTSVEGDCHFTDSEFRTYTKPEPPSQPMDASPVPANSPEQIDQDYLVALSLQQEQPQNQMAWGQIDPQQVPVLSDLELARSLQEEERRAAEAEGAQLQQQQQRGQPAGAHGHAQRPRDREPREREEKKSDCSIL